MKRVGIIGGIGPESTIAYYRQIIAQFQDRLYTNDLPEVIFDCINLNEMLRYAKNDDLVGLSVFLSKAISRLEKTGVDFMALASNTPHIVFDALSNSTEIPLVSIVTSTCHEISKRRIKKVGIFGSKLTMMAGFYQKEARNFGFEIISPNDERANFIDSKYLTEIVFNRISAKTKLELIRIAQDMLVEDNIEGIILGGTELPLILNQSDLPNMILFDTTQIHVNSLVNKMIGS